MHPINWLIVIAYLAYVVIDGLRKTKDTDTIAGYFAANKSLSWWVVGLSGHGDAALRRDDDRVDRSGRHGRAPLRADLLRPAVGDGDSRSHDRATPPRLGRLHRVRVPGAALRREDEIADGVPLPAVPRPFVRHDHGRASGRLQRHLRGAARLGGRVDRRPHRALHDGGWRAGGRVGGREADGPHRCGASRHHGGASLPDAGEARRGADDRRRRPGGYAPSTSRSTYERDLHVLVRRDRRHLPHALLLRHGSEPGTAIPHGPVGRRGEELAADERVLEDPAAGPRPDGRRRCLRLLPVHVPRRCSTTRRRRRRSSPSEEPRTESSRPVRRRLRPSGKRGP